MQGNFAGDGMQMAGVFVIGPGGKVFLDRRQKFYGDDPTPVRAVSIFGATCGCGWIECSFSASVVGVAVATLYLSLHHVLSLSNRSSLSVCLLCAGGYLGRG